MNAERNRSARKGILSRIGAAISRMLIVRVYTTLMLGALACTVLVKFYHAHRMNLMDEYLTWIFADIAVLLGVELALSFFCMTRPTRRMMRIAAFIAALMTTWAVMNASWIIRNGGQLPVSMVKPIIRDPINTFLLIVGNLINLPQVAVIMVTPSVIALAVLFRYLARPPQPNYNRRRYYIRAIICMVIIAAATILHATITRRSSPNLLSTDMRYNNHLRAATNIIMRNSLKLTHADYEQAKRMIPTARELNQIIDVQPRTSRQNVVVVILEGVQYSYTSFDGRHGDLTPFMAKLAEQGVEFSNMRSTLTHTTKAIFSLMTGRYPSVSHDYAETVPIDKGYASLATILGGKLGYRTAFFQSAKGNFESRPGLVHNLGFGSFWARDMLKDPNSIMDPNSFVGYLSCDEFEMIEPITDWIQAGDEPFLLTILCSVTHDPYEVPEWFAEPAREQPERYAQTVEYTDTFIEALDARISALSPAENTIFCVVGDHGEAFGEHGLHGHEMISYEEALHIPWVMRAQSLIDPATRINAAVSSIDFTPTVLSLLAMETEWAGFDGTDVIESRPRTRKVYFSGWIDESPAGFIRDNGKFVYYPATQMVTVYDLVADPCELAGVTLPEEEAARIVKDITAWCRNSVLKIDQKRNGNALLYDLWYCRWNNRTGDVSYRKKGFGWR